MKFLILYLFAFFVVFTLGFIIEWFQNPKGRREITARNALIIIAVSLFPGVNVVCAVFIVIVFIAFLLDIFGVAEWFDRLRFKTLFTDRK